MSLIELLKQSPFALSLGMVEYTNKYFDLNESKVHTNELLTAMQLTPLAGAEAAGPEPAFTLHYEKPTPELIAFAEEQQRSTGLNSLKPSKALYAPPPKEPPATEPDVHVELKEALKKQTTPPPVPDTIEDEHSLRQSLLELVEESVEQQLPELSEDEEELPTKKRKAPPKEQQKEVNEPVKKKQEEVDEPAEKEIDKSTKKEKKGADEPAKKEIDKSAKKKKGKPSSEEGELSSIGEEATTKKRKHKSDSEKKKKKKKPKSSSSSSDEVFLRLRDIPSSPEVDAEIGAVTRAKLDRRAKPKGALIDPDRVLRQQGFRVSDLEAQEGGDDSAEEAAEAPAPRHRPAQRKPSPTPAPTSLPPPKLLLKDGLRASVTGSSGGRPGDLLFENVDPRKRCKVLFERFVQLGKDVASNLTGVRYPLTADPEEFEKQVQDVARKTYPNSGAHWQFIELNQWISEQHGTRTVISKLSTTLDERSFPHSSTDLEEVRSLCILWLAANPRAFLTHTLAQIEQEQSLSELNEAGLTKVLIPLFRHWFNLTVFAHFRGLPS